MRHMWALFSLIVGQVHAGSLLTFGPGGIPNLTITPVVPNTAPVWTTLADRDLTNGNACTYALTSYATDAESDPLQFTLVSGALPTGCSLALNGTISGTTTTPGTYTFTLGVNDSHETTLREAGTSTTTFASTQFTPAQNEQFRATYTLTPVANNIDHVCGFSNVTATGYGNILAAVRMSTAGVFDARNNSAYAAANVLSYSVGNIYTVIVDVNVPAGTYSATVNGTSIASNYVFRGAALPANLGYFTCVDAVTPGLTGTTTGALTLLEPVNATAIWTVAAGGDVTPPSAPSAPTLDGVTQTTVSMTLPTSAAGDHSFYRIQRSPSGCGSYAQIQDNYTSTTFTDTGRTASTAYCYRLIDVDTSGNASGNGTGLTATTSAVDVNALLSIADVSQAEGNSGTASMTFTLTASASQAFNIVCSYETIAGTADSATDFVATSGTATITAGNTTTPIAVTINGDTTQESDEAFQVRVYNCGNGGTSVNATEFLADGTITNDDVTASTTTTYNRTDTAGNAFAISFTYSCTGGAAEGTFADGWSKYIYPITPGGSCTISAMTPTKTGTGSALRNGAMADPDNLNENGFTGINQTGRITTFNESLNLVLPYTVNPSSLGRPTVVIKSYGGSDTECTNNNRQCFYMFETLTILATNPGDVFRPAWYGTTSKTMYSASSITTAFLPSVAQPSGGQTWDQAVEVMRSVFMQPMKRAWNESQGLSALVNQRTGDGYHGYVVQQQAGAFMKLAQLATGADVAKKEQLARFVAQRAIDLYGIMNTATAQVTASGSNSSSGIACAPWIANGGFNIGRLPTVLMGAFLLQQSAWVSQIEALTATASGRGCFEETSGIQLNPSAVGKGVPTYGGLNTPVYTFSCTGTNMTCADVGGASSATAASYLGRVDTNPGVPDPGPNYFNVRPGLWLSFAMPIMLSQRMKTGLTTNSKYWMDFVDRSKRLGDANSSTSFSYYADTASSTPTFASSDYNGAGNFVMWAAIKDCYVANSCTGIGAP